MLWLRRLLPVAIILALLVVGLVVINATRPQPEKKEEIRALPLVEVEEIRSDDITLTLNSYGVVQPKHQTQLVAEVSGRIVELDPRFIAGGEVKRGQILARIEPADYQADLMQAQANLAQAKAQLQEEIARGKVAEQEWKGVTSGLPPELGLRKPQLAQEQAKLRSAEAALARAQRNLERTVIRAPLDGLIKSRDVDLGQYVSLGIKLGEVLGTDVAEIRLPLSSEQLRFVNNPDNPDSLVTLTQESPTGPLNWTARLVRSEQVIDAQSRMIYLVARIDDPYNQQGRLASGVLKFGSFVKAQIQGRTLHNIVRLPRHSVRNDTVMVIGEGNRLERRPVEVVHTDLNSVYIRGDIGKGDRISLTALNSFQDGSEVRILGDDSRVDAGTALSAEVNANE
ncbi:efflux RND transporter periplasmic adaptor subunit [Ferrimonas sediminicola]|uniref:Efflux RND transporter periplasmic adaptor subunit n=1 Tax=Ferrimonas sediminicola TaxID=2569538 RepID=A0A4U1BCA1_9GAMM|nr:efflux RND transporter periplasmic adaptor subunit [Ferrimonas sediminicola]TKB48653.1 efflux RND transporter periplasmic adaptor subunit [Ferrimonas sediminicola]